MAEFSGHLSLVAAPREHGRTVLAHQAFRAPFHISKPYWDADVRALLVQVVNPTAGVLAGDSLESAIRVERDAALIVTTPSASRLFQMRGGGAEGRQHFAVSGGGWLEVMPEPLVPHRGSRFRQITTIDVAAEAGLFFVDQLMPGRVGHGEAWEWERLQLELTVRVGGELALRERLDQSGEDLRAMATLAGPGPTPCFANAILVAPAAAGSGGTLERPVWRDEVNALHHERLRVGVSALRRGGWSLRLIGADASALREGLQRLRTILAPHVPRLGCNLRKL